MDRTRKTSEERFRIELEGPRCNLTLELPGQDPQDPSRVASQVLDFALEHRKFSRGTRKVNVLDRATGHYYEIQVDGKDPDRWTWTRLTFALAPIRARDASSVFARDPAPTDWREGRGGAERKRRIHASLGLREEQEHAEESAPAW